MSCLSFMVGDLLAFFKVFSPKFRNEGGFIFLKDEDSELLFSGCFGSGEVGELGQLHDWCINILKDISFLILTRFIMGRVVNK